MGLELIDLIFRTETRFGVRIEAKDVAALFGQRHPPDASVAEFCQMIRVKLELAPDSLGTFAPDARCSVCGYCLYTLSPRARCPECGTELAMEGGVESGVRRDLAAATGVNPADIHPASLLRADLEII